MSKRKLGRALLFLVYLVQMEIMVSFEYILFILGLIEIDIWYTFKYTIMWVITFLEPTYAT